MIISNGTTNITVKLQEDFKLNVDLAYYFLKADSNRIVPIDRGFTSDLYSVELFIAGELNEIDSFVDFVEASRNEGIMTFRISLDGEPIFGENIDYGASSIDASISNIGMRRNIAKNSYGITFELTAVTNTLVFIPFTGEPFSDICVQYQTQEYNNYTYQFNTAYNTSYHYITDSHDDYGTFTGTFLVNAEQMGKIRNYYRNIRGNAFTLTQDMLQGVLYPFGTTRPSYPTTAHFDSVSEKLINTDRYSVEITLIEGV